MIFGMENLNFTQKVMLALPDHVTEIHPSLLETRLQPAIVLLVNG